MKVDQTRAFADALELDMQFQSFMERMCGTAAYGILKDDPEAINVAFSRLCGGSRWTWACFLWFNLPKSWEHVPQQETRGGFVGFNVNQCVHAVRKWGKENGYDVGDGTCER